MVLLDGMKEVYSKNRVKCFQAIFIQSLRSICANNQVKIVAGFNMYRVLFKIVQIDAKILINH